MRKRVNTKKMAAFGAAIFLCLIGFLNAQAQSQPQVFEKYHINKTFKSFSDTVLLDFKYKNTTADTLYLIKAKPTCGCIIPSIKKMTLAPGEHGDYKVMFLPRAGQDFNNGSITLEFDFGMQVLSFSAILKPE